MNKMFRSILAGVMALLMVPAAAFAAEGEVPINETRFPDALFRQYVAEKVDQDQNGSLSEGEIHSVEWIDMNNTGVADLTGIEIFPELTNLFCSGSQLSKLDVRQNTKLERLVCSKNQLAELDLSCNPELIDLHCYDNQLTELDLSYNPKIGVVNCHNNPLQTLRLRGAEQLRVVTCSSCQLSDIDVSANFGLEVLDCRGNYLTELDVSHNPELKHLIVGRIYRGPAGDVQDRSGNQLTELDVSHNPKLSGLECDLNHLTSLDLSGNPAIESLFCEENTMVVADGTSCSALSGSFDVAKVSDVQGGVMDSGEIRFASGSDQMTYTYTLGDGKTAKFTLIKDPDVMEQPTEPNIQDVPDNTDGTGTTGGSEISKEGTIYNDLSHPAVKEVHKTDTMGNLLLDGYKAEKGTIRVNAADVMAAAKTVSADKKLKGLTFQIGTATVTYDRKALQLIGEKACDAEIVQITVQPVMGSDRGMNEAQQKVAVSYPGETIFKLSLATIGKNGKVQEIHDFGGGYAVVRVPFHRPKDETIEVFRLEEDGSLTAVERIGDANEDTVGWKTPSHSYYLIKSTEADTPAEAESGNGIIAGIIAVCVVGAISGAAYVIYRRRNP